MGISGVYKRVAVPSSNDEVAPESAPPSSDADMLRKRRAMKPGLKYARRQDARAEIMDELYEMSCDSENFRYRKQG